MARSVNNMMDPAGGVAAAAWLVDPSGRYQWRYWDGQAWTNWVGNEAGTGWDSLVSGPSSDERDKLAYLRSYLVGAVARGVISPAVAEALDTDAAAWQQVPELAAPTPIDLRSDRLPQSAAPTTSAPLAMAEAPAIPTPPASPSMPPPQVPRHSSTAAADSNWSFAVSTEGPVTKRPQRIRAWIRHAISGVSSELAAHGLADFGALLLFAGLFGFVAFALGSVSPGLRPVAEVAIPVTAFGAGWFLRRKGTPWVGNVLVLVGAALLPVVTIASLSDGASPPPDLSGAGLIAALVLVLLATAGVEALLAHRDPTSSLRFAVAPTAWLAVAAAGLGIDRVVPSGSDLATPKPAQWAIVVVAILLTLALTQFKANEFWARSVAVSAWPSLAVAYVMTMVSAERVGWPPVPVLVAGLGVIVGLELLTAGRHWVSTSSVQITVLIVTAAAVSNEWPFGWIACGIAIALVGLAEVRQFRSAPRWFIWGLLSFAALAVLACGWDLQFTPAALMVAGAVGWAWAAAQIQRPSTLERVQSRVLVWLFPIPFVIGLAAWSTPPTATVVSASLVLLVAILTRVLPPQRRSPWPQWVVTAGGLTLLAVLGQVGNSSASTVAAAALVATAFVILPQRRQLSIATVVSSLLVTGVAAADWLDWTPQNPGPAVSLLAGLVLLGSSIALRRKVLSSPTWAALSAVAMLANMIAIVAWLLNEADPYPAGLALVAGSSAVAVGLALAAAPSGWRWLRDVSMVAATVAMLLLIPTLNASTAWVAAVAAATAVLSASVRMLAQRNEPLSTWQRPLLELTVISLLISFSVSLEPGPGWRTLALSAIAVATALTSVTLTGAWRRITQWVVAAATVSAWLSMGEWLQWSNEAMVARGSVAAAVVLAGSAGALWVTKRGRDWVFVSSLSGTFALLIATVELYEGGLDRSLAGPWVAGSLFVAAVASAAAVQPLEPASTPVTEGEADLGGLGAAGLGTAPASADAGQTGETTQAAVSAAAPGASSAAATAVRIASVVFLGASLAVFLDVAGSDAKQILAVAVGVGLLATLGLVGISLTGRASRWGATIEIVAIAAAAGALLVAPAVGSNGIAVLFLLVGAELAAIGTVRDQQFLVYFAPAALCTSWVVFASSFTESSPSWFTVPAGLTVLVTVELARRQRRSRSLEPTTKLLSFIEAAGMVLLVVTPLVQIVQLGPIHVIESLLLGLALAVWGALTQVRRRLLAGIVTTALAVGLLIVISAVDIAQRVSGPLLWLVIAAAGVFVVLVAGFLESRRSHSEGWRSRLDERVAGWE